jgi:MFS family permease
MTKNSQGPHETSLSDGVDVAAITVPFAAIVLAMLPAVLDQTILSTALPTIAADLGRISDVSWLVTAYVVAAAAATPLWCNSSDLGHSRCSGGLAIFLRLGLTGIAQSSVLVVSRAIPGAGGW